MLAHARKMSRSHHPVVEIDRLTVQRDGYILRDISWKIHAGENWVLLGANGSGKTSLLKAITGYLAESKGEIVIDGDEDADWQELREHIGFVSSSISQKIDDEETAFEIVISGKYAMINYWGPIRRSDRAIAKEILANVEAANLANRPWWQLSQGERQRVLIGRALMAEQRLLLILDEPCAGLDPAARETFLAFLERFAADGGSPGTILVTHHVEEITPAFGHVLVLKDGRTHASGPKTKVLNSEILSDAFGADIRVRQRSGRYTAVVTPNSGVVL